MYVSVTASVAWTYAEIRGQLEWLFSSVMGILGIKISYIRVDDKGPYLLSHLADPKILLHKLGRLSCWPVNAHIIYVCGHACSSYQASGQI